MQFSDEVYWTLSDFLIAAFLLFGTGLIFEPGMRKINNHQNRILSGTVILINKP